MGLGKRLSDFLSQDIRNPILKVGFLAIPIVVVAIGIGGTVHHLTKPKYPVNVSKKLTFELRQRLVSFGCWLPHQKPIREWPRILRINPDILQQILNKDFAPLDALADYDNSRFRLMQVGEVIPANKCLSDGMLRALSDTACVILRPAPFLAQSDTAAVIAYADAYNREIAKLANNGEPCPQ